MVVNIIAKNLQMWMMSVVIFDSAVADHHHNYDVADCPLSRLTIGVTDFWYNGLRK